MTNGTADVAIIGGSGFYELEGLADVEEYRAETPFGEPSDTIVLGALDGVRMAFLPRHGVGHRILPAELPARANIWALKRLGVERIIAVSAVGSLRRKIAPLDVVVPDQLIDRTRGRPSTFFGRGLVAHIAFDQPFCPQLSALLSESGAAADTMVHKGGTGIVIDGPAFSTKSESRMYQSWDADIIGMTALPEAKLAREAEICYTTIALVTDYDCWRDGEESVSVELVVANLDRNVERSRSIIRELAGRIPANRTCPCASALENAIITRPDQIPPEATARLSIIVNRYLRAPREVV